MISLRVPDAWGELLFLGPIESEQRDEWRIQRFKGVHAQSQGLFSLFPASVPFRGLLEALDRIRGNGAGIRSSR
jgi:hypothetical protein